MLAENLTAKQAVFVGEYLVDLNATQAAIRAGYSAKTANAQAGRLLVNVSIQTAIQEAIKARSERTGITADRVLQEIARLAYANMGDFATWDKDSVSLVDSKTLDEDQLAAVSEVGQTVTKDGGSVKIKLHDKGKALELLARHLGLLVDRHEINVNTHWRFTIGKGYDESDASRVVDADPGI